MKQSAFDMGLSFAEVIARRLPGLWRGLLSPTAASQAELVRMVVEKQMAFVEACHGVQMELALMMLLPFAPLRAERFMEAALAPAARRVKANVKRLRG